MINDAGKHSVKAGIWPVSLRASEWGLPAVNGLNAAGEGRGAMKALAEQIVDLDSAEIYGRVSACAG